MFFGNLTENMKPIYHGLSRIGGADILFPVESKSCNSESRYTRKTFNICLHFTD